MELVCGQREVARLFVKLESCHPDDDLLHVEGFFHLA